MKVYVESKDDIVEARADSRGRITLGSEFAHENVTVAVIDRESQNNEEH